MKGFEFALCCEPHALCLASMGLFFLPFLSPFLYCCKSLRPVEELQETILSETAFDCGRLVIMRKLPIVLITVLIAFIVQIPKDSSSQSTPCESRCRNEYAECVSGCQQLRAGWSAIDSCVNQCTQKWIQCNRQCQ